MLRHVVRLAAVTFAVAAAGVVVPPRADAATCGTASGVSVVVDFHQLKGGGAETACDSGGAGKYAAAQFTDAGHTLTYVQDEPFVCKVDGFGSPQCERTPPADAYWSLWWSDGKSGTWKYAAVGVTSLKVPAGGYVALSWQQGNAQVPPRVKPTAHGPSSSPTSHPTTAPTSHSTQGPTQHPTAGPTSGPTASAPVAPTGTPSSSGRTKHPHHSGTKHAQVRHHPSTTSNASKALAGDPVSAVTPGDGGGSGSAGLPGWVAPVAVVLLFAVGGSVALLRRKSSGGT